METLLIALVGILIVLTIITIVLVVQKKEAPKQDGDALLMLQNQLNEINKTMDTKLGESHKSMQAQFGQSAKIIADVTEKLTTLESTNKQVIGFSEQLNNLEKVLTSQKQRGNLGEAGLHLVLENILPPTAFQLQYQFDDGDTVDAAIFTKDGIIPVDAKFSFENYRRLVGEEDEDRKKVLENEFKNDLKKRIEETSKYIKPNKGTLDFAFMFIPTEAIYYDLLVNEVGAVKVNTRNLIDYAFREKKVIIVSPTTFAAYLQTVLQGLRALKIEEQTKEIIKTVGNLERHILAYDEHFKKIGTNIVTVVNTYDKAQKELGKIDKDVLKITKTERDLIEPIEIEKPRGNE